MYPIAPTTPVIEVRDAFCLLEVADGAVAALRGINLSVDNGEKIVIHGPNGSGKTTLLRVLIGEQRLAAGEAFVAGWPVGHGNRAGLAAWRARHVGWVDQHAGRTLRPELDVLDNVALQERINGASGAAARDLARGALDVVGVAHLADRGINDLSGGEAQRVAVAAALVHRPAVVFADEPAGQLDADSAEQVYRALADAVTGIGAALVVVSHDQRASHIADRVLRIRDGRASETWRPTRPGDELLVVDPRGWVRLPADARSAAGLGGEIRLRVDRDGRAVLQPATDPDALFRRQPAADTSAVDEPSPELGALAPPRPDATRFPAPAAPPVVEPVAVCRDVVRHFGDRTVLGGVDVAFGPGEVHVVHGRSGSGKSTLLRLLVGLDRPDGGEVRVAGLDLGELDRAGLAEMRRMHVGMVLQEIHLAETATLLGNLDIARSVRRLAADPVADRRLLERLGLSDLAGRQARHCSGGERQRAAFARAVVGGPALVVLDEPTSQLDEASAERAMAVVRELAAAGATVVVASHDPVVVASAHRVLDLDARPAPLVGR